MKHSCGFSDDGIGHECCIDAKKWRDIRRRLDKYGEVYLVDNQGKNNE